MKQVKYNLEANLYMLQTIAEKLEGLREKSKKIVIDKIRAIANI